jgi:4-hydroxythreonine-4-phosphate dehydrogenase
MARIAVTLGDPAGVGPEVVARALNARPAGQGHSVVLVGGESVFRAMVSRAATPVTFPYKVVHAESEIGGQSGVWFLSVEVEEAFAVGGPSSAAARQALAAIDRGADLALRGSVDALVTGPVSKKSIADLGVSFSGHTEYLAARAGVRHTVMMFTAEARDGPPLRVAFVTTHLPIRKLPTAITPERVHRVIDMTAESLRRHFGIERPRLAVAGLNPHAGEEGLFGREEREVIEPAILLSRGKGIDCSGPYAADTIFWRAREEKFDAIVVMYHDQALPLIKTAYPEAVNTTLGLPFVRTSPDHGPAYDKAGKGTAEWRPMAAAIQTALRMTASPKGSA